MTEKSKKVSQKFYCEMCDYLTSRKCDFEKHLRAKKHLDYQNSNLSNLSKKVCEKFTCVICNYNAKRKCDLEKHFKTKKHCSNKDNESNKKIYNCEICGKSYVNKQGLYKHKKQYNHYYDKQLEYTLKEKEQYKDLILQVLNDNKILQELLIKQQQDFIKQQEETNKKFENLVLHVKPNNTITHNNTINNKTFNILMFLNDKCKDAMTIQDFAERLVVTIEDLEKKKYECLSNIILKNIKGLSITDRPFHCANIKKKEWYLHDKFKGWEKDNGDKLIKNAEYGISKKYNNEFIRNYPDYLMMDNLRDKYMRLISKLFTDLPEKENARLLNELAKDLTINNEII